MSGDIYETYIAKRQTFLSLPLGQLYALPAWPDVAAQKEISASEDTFPCKVPCVLAYA